MKRLAACHLLLAAPAAATPLLMMAAAAPQGAGIWFGIGQTGDRGGMYIDNMLPDGRIVTQFRSCIKGKGEDHIQIGTWSISGRDFVIQVNQFDGQPAPRTDRYKVLSITERNFNYDLLPTSFPFRAKRVGPDFKMPDCDFIS